MYRVSIKKTASLLITSFILLSSSVLGGCGKKTVDPVDDNYRVFYEIFVGSFSDSNGDGVGALGSRASGFPRSLLPLPITSMMSRTITK